MYLGDFKEDGDIFHKFSTRAFATGIPTTLAGTPVLSVYKDEGGAATEKTTAEAYFDLDVDHDSISGWHNVRMDLSGDAYFATGADYMVVITTGTVGGVSVVGENLFTFSIENRSMGQPTGATLATDINALTSNLLIASSQLVVVESNTIVIESDTIVISSDTTAIHSQTTVIESDSIIVESSIQVAESNTVVIESDTIKISSDTTAIHSQTTVIESDSIIVESSIQVAESNTVVIESDTIVIEAGVDVTKISGSATAADNLEASALGIGVGTVNTGVVAATITTFQSADITSPVEATADHFIGRIIVFYDSADALYLQATDITDYEKNGAEAKFTFTALTEAPSDADKFVIV